MRRSVITGVKPELGRQIKAYFGSAQKNVSPKLEGLFRAKFPEFTEDSSLHAFFEQAQMMSEQRGKVLVCEGDSPSKVLLLVSGEAATTRKHSSSQYRSGDLIGFVEAFYKQNYLEKVVASTSCSYLTFRADVFLKHFEESLVQDQRFSQLQNSGFLQVLQPCLLNYLSKRFVEEEILWGHQIIKPGESSSKVYFIQEGSVVIQLNLTLDIEDNTHLKKSEAFKYQLVELTNGSVFGEDDLLHPCPENQISVRTASHKCRLLAVDKDLVRHLIILGKTQAEYERLLGAKAKHRQRLLRNVLKCRNNFLFRTKYTEETRGKTIDAAFTTSFFNKEKPLSIQEYSEFINRKTEENPKVRDKVREKIVSLSDKKYVTIPFKNIYVNQCLKKRRFNPTLEHRLHRVLTPEFPSRPRPRLQRQLSRQALRPREQEEARTLSVSEVRGRLLRQYKSLQLSCKLKGSSEV